MTESSHPNVPALPATREDLLAQRRIMASPTLNDYVDEIHLALWDDPHYQQLLRAVWVEETVEGSINADDLQAAAMIRQYARDNKVVFVADKKLATIAKSLTVIMRRYRISRQERRRMVHGEIVTNSNSSDQK